MFLSLWWLKVIHFVLKELDLNSTGKDESLRGKDRVITMSGHSKWSTIKRKKEKTDGARAKIFTKIGRELAVAVKEGGSADPVSNSKLKDCIAKAKANNVPNDNIERII